MKKTLLVGSFGAKNIGDELILQAALQKHKSVIVATANAEASIDFSPTWFATIPSFPCGIKSLFRFFLSPKQRKIYQATAPQIKKMVFPGGGLFKNNFKAVWIWTLNVFWLKHFFPNKKIIFEAQGVDKLNNYFVQKLALWSFNQAHRVSVRDEQSKQNLINLGYEHKIKVVPDVAHEFLQTQNLLPIKTNQKQILIQASKNFNAEKLRTQIAKRFPQHQIQFVAFDAIDIPVIRRNTHLPTEKIVFPQTYQDTINLFQNSQVFIGQRFHFLILAHLINPKRTFLLHKPYAPKTETLAKSLGIEKF
ncbi:hypothetical protein CSB37_00340 [bacterium DOLZORAL124_38_8]|nr:MAG: hypothetical protein CSB37_00340 [bacterium DOLZORAL124_38_8]